MLYKQQMHHGEGGLGTRLQHTHTCASRNLAGEATKCRLCKHCGCKERWKLVTSDALEVAISGRNEGH